MAIRLVFNPKSGWTGKAKNEPITYREMHILSLSAQGYSNKEIAEMLGLAYQTVKNNFKAPGVFLTSTYDHKLYFRWKAWERLPADIKRLMHNITVRYNRANRKSPIHMGD